MYKGQSLFLRYLLNLKLRRRRFLPNLILEGQEIINCSHNKQTKGFKDDNIIMRQDFGTSRG